MCTVLQSNMNTTLVMLMTSLLMGTSFLQKVTEEPTKSRSGARTYINSHPFAVGGEGGGGGGQCWGTSPHQHGQETDHKLIDGYPFGRPLGEGIAPGGGYPGGIPGRGFPGNFPSGGGGGGGGGQGNCKVRIGLHYSSCFSKFEDFDDKFGELQHHVPSLPRGVDGFSSPCSTLRLLAKVKSTPLHDRCLGNQYILRIPFHMYNIKGELRYIVQDPPQIEQCYLEAACNIPTQLCNSLGYPSTRQPTNCEPRQCHHTLLTWDPANPNLGTFFDTFEYSCCCNCHVIPVPGRSPLVG